MKYKIVIVVIIISFFLIACSSNCFLDCRYDEFNEWKNNNCNNSYCNSPETCNCYYEVPKNLNILNVKCKSECI